MALLDDLSKKNGVVYTPGLLADYVAKKALEYYSSLSQVQANLRVLDPACGKGELLSAIWRNLRDSPSSTDKKFVALDVLCGTDISKASIEYTAQEIKVFAPPSINKQPKVFAFNALLPSPKYSISEYWDLIKRDFSANKGFDIVIANPPWGADVSSYREELDASFFSLLKGQYDTSDLFFELALYLVKPKGIVAFIIPDSLFAFEHRKLRELMVTKTQILYLGRLGEGFFPDVFRGCAVVIAQKCKPKLSGLVDCLRLDSDSRQMLFESKTTFSYLEKKNLHKVPQSRFIKDQDYVFDIDTTVREEKIVKKIASGKALLGDFLGSFRGVELSKKGLVTRCANCLFWTPTPKKDITCSRCGKKIILEKAETQKIVRETPARNFTPIIVGEGIGRYRISKKLYLDSTKKGINYKDNSIYQQPRILVRKTGVGITASIDYSGALTNQVVYSFFIDSSKKLVLPIELFLAIINSRLMYYYIIKRFGEIEWRSHPYLTLKHVRDLPLPVELVNKFKENREYSQTIKMLSRLLQSNRPVTEKVDANIERLVAELYGFSLSDYRIMYKTFNSIEKLRPVQALLTITPDEIFSRKLD